MHALAHGAHDKHATHRDAGSRHRRHRAYIWESEANGKKVRLYTLEYRSQIEGDIAKASVEFIERQAKAKQPFFLYVGFTNTHYPIRTAPEFERTSRIGPYGDAIMELDYRTGQVLDAIKADDPKALKAALKLCYAEE